MPLADVVAIEYCEGNRTLNEDGSKAHADGTLGEWHLLVRQPSGPEERLVILHELPGTHRRQARQLAAAVPFPMLHVRRKVLRGLVADPIRP